MLIMEDLLQHLGVGLRSMRDPFFNDSYRMCGVLQRQGIIIDIEEELYHENIKEFSCYVPGCKDTFQTLLDYEMHYNSSHRYTCTECKASKPNPRLLEIHIQEMHDAFFKVLSEKQAMYQCYDSECDIKFNNPMERREHCINIHKFPKKYRFDDSLRYSKEDESNKMECDDEVSNKKKKITKVSLNKNQKSKMFTATTNAICENNDKVETIPSTINKTNTATSLIFVPRQVQKSFAKVLTNDKNREKNVLESETMMELADSIFD